MTLDPVSEKHYHNPVAGFTKLFSSLIFSTVWREEMHVKVVWITMLAMANRNGEVLASVPGLADAARVSLDQVQDALTKLGAPDPWSRTKEYEGRRIVEVDGGWRLLNYPKYRELRDADERRIQTREAVRQHRARKKAEAVTVSTVSPRKPRKAQAEAEAEAEADLKSKSKSKAYCTPDNATDSLFDVAWNQYPKRGGSNPRRDALHAWKARLGEEVSPAEMIAGVGRYRAFCERTGKLGSEYVMQARRFFGPSRPFAESWEMPSDPDAWKHDRFAFRPGESQEAYILRVSGNGR